MAAASSAGATDGIATVEVVDAFTAAPIVGVTVAAKKRVTDGLTWVAERTTDGSGRATFQLAGLGSGTTYVFFTNAFGAGIAQSADLSQPGTLRFPVGTLPVRAVAGGTLAPLSGAKVTLRERLADSTLVWISNGTADSDGRVTFDPPGLGSGRVFVLEAASPWDGLTKRSSDIVAPGPFTFVVGDAPLRVTLKNAITGAALAAQTINAYERLADGTSRWTVARTTDAAGFALFELPGLGAGRTYFLTVTPYNGGPANTPDLTSAGDFIFAVGALEVTVVNGSDGSLLPNLHVDAREQLADGTLRWAAGGTTDAQAVIRFDLPGLGSGRVYVLEAKSPTDGVTRRSAPLTTGGRQTFRVGNAPLVTVISNALTGAVLPGVAINVWERQTTGSLLWLMLRTSDSSGRAVFDLAGLGTGKTYVAGAAPYNGGMVYGPDVRDPGTVQLRVGAVETTVVDAGGAPLAGLKVVASEKAADGTLVFAKWGNTDAAGIIRFDFDGLGAGKTYLLEAKSPVDGKTKRSQDITSAGRYVFRLGNPALDVVVSNALTGVRLTGLSVNVWERLATGSLSWVMARTTDATGHAVFELPGLGSGRTYVPGATPYNGGMVYGPAVSQPGTVELRVGAVEVSVVSGATGAALAGLKVGAFEKASDGTLTYVTGGNTDSAGVIRFDFSGFPAGKTYVLDAKSPTDGSRKFSQSITQAGRYTFTVGSPALRVTVANGVTGSPVPGVSVGAYELLANGDRRWAATSTVDSAGKVVFDLDGIGAGRVYELAANPYGVGTARSGLIDQPGDVVFRAGTVPVAVIDGDHNVPLAGARVDVYEILADKSLRWTKVANADANGTIRFDLAGVSRTTPTAPVGGRRYVLVAWNPFGVAKQYFSSIIDSEGPLEFRITRDGLYPLDLEPPMLSVTSPANGSSVDDSGFTVSGFASDDRAMSRVVVMVVDPVTGSSAGQATYDAQSERWSFTVSRSAITLGQTAIVAVRAYDQANNQTVVNLSVRVIDDVAAPVVSITSHRDGDEVEKTGFLLAGTARDDIAVARVVASVDDPVLGRTVDRVPVELSADGRWSFSVRGGQLTEGQTITVSMEATDTGGNPAAAVVRLPVGAVDFAASHLINRITFGATPELDAEVASIGADAFLAQQLAPETIDDSQFAAMIAAEPRPATTAELQRYALLHMIHSRRQLGEVLTQFWDNHFNTDVNKSRVVAYELADNDAFRQNALGRFRDLLAVSAHSPAMLVYLDNVANYKASPNENYARELMELHTLGVDGGYTQSDVEQVARAFTGWQVQNGQFFFNAASHDTSAKTVLGQTLPAGRGIEDGNQVLDILARHPSTARFLCTKLSQLFVSDKPPAALVDRCADAYLGSDGQIGTTVASILRSPEFADPLAFRNKVKTPLEFVVGVVRNVGASTDTSDLIAAMEDMGMRLFQNPVPTGWSETGDDWMNTNALIQRIRFANHVANAAQNGPDTWIDPRSFFSDAGFTTAEGITGFLFQMLFHHDYTELDRQVALDILNGGGTSAFDIDAPSADARLRRLVGTVMSYPGYELQ